MPPSLSTVYLRPARGDKTVDAVPALEALHVQQAFAALVLYVYVKFLPSYRY